MTYWVLRAEALEEGQRNYEGIDPDSDEARDHPALLTRAFNRMENAGWTLVNVIPRVPTVVTDNDNELASPHTASFVWHKSE